MDFKTFLVIVFAVLLVVSTGLYHYGKRNVYLTYKDQRVGARTK